MGGDQHWSTWNVCCIWLGCLIESNGWQVYGGASNLEKLSFLLANTLSLEKGKRLCMCA
jgi:cytosine/uracil/thiamine/allantoin permease